MTDELHVADGDDLEGALSDADEGATLTLAAADFDGGLTLRKSLTLRGTGESTRIVGTRGSVFRVIGEGVTLTLEDLVLTEGQAELGGAVHLASGASLVARRCRFEQNVAKHKGGAVYLSDGRAELVGCDLLDNRAGSGGAILAEGLATLVMDDCRVTHNEASTGAGIHIADGAEATLTALTCEGQSGDGVDLEVRGSLSRAPVVTLSGSRVSSTQARPESALRVLG